MKLLLTDELLEKLGNTYVENFFKLKSAEISFSQFVDGWIEKNTILLERINLKKTNNVKELCKKIFIRNTKGYLKWNC